MNILRGKSAKCAMLDTPATDPLCLCSPATLHRQVHGQPQATSSITVRCRDALSEATIYIFLSQYSSSKSPICEMRKRAFSRSSALPVST